MKQKKIKLTIWPMTTFMTDVGIIIQLYRTKTETADCTGALFIPKVKPHERGVVMRHLGELV